MKRIQLLAAVLSFAFICTGCVLWDGIRGCPDGIIDWADVLMVDDIKYQGDFTQREGEPLPETGERLGKVTYTLDGHACSNHKLKNGEASYVPVGTEVLAVEGYKPEFRVIADGRVFQVTDNPKAETLGDLADIQGKVTGISIRSDEDDSPLGELDAEQTTAFLDDYLALPYEREVEETAPYKRNNRVILYFHLKDGSSYHTIYTFDENIIGNEAHGTESMKEMIGAFLEE